MSKKTYVRIQYEVPPMRAMWSDWIEEQKSASDDDYKVMYQLLYPTRKICTIERGISKTSMDFLTGVDDARQDNA